MARIDDPVKTLGAWAGESDLPTCGMVRVEVLRGLKIPRVRDWLAAFFDVMINVPSTNRPDAGRAGRLEAGPPTGSSRPTGWKTQTPSRSISLTASALMSFSLWKTGMFLPSSASEIAGDCLHPAPSMAEFRRSAGFFQRLGKSAYIR